jgi:hypothetical protein
MTSKPCSQFPNGKSNSGDCPLSHAREAKKIVCKLYLDGKCEERECKLSHVGTSPPKISIYFKGGDKRHENGIRLLLEFDKRNYSLKDKLAALGRHFKVLMEMFFTMVTTNKGVILWLSLLIFSLKKHQEEAQNFYEILGLILGNSAFRESLKSRISSWLEMIFLNLRKILALEG